jgi:hypothetical protein
MMENRLGIVTVRGKVRTHTFNGKVERFFRTFKTWARLKLFAWFADRERIARRMQRRLGAFRDWYNAERSHGALGGRTPEEAWIGKRKRRTRAVRAHESQPHIRVVRRSYRGDRHLPVIEVRVDRSNVA